MSSVTTVIGPFGSGPGPGGGGGEGADPYPLYTSFDRNTVPWHTAAGSWGAQYALDAPTPPTTTRNVTVNNTTDFDTEAAVSGSRITIGTSFSGSSVVTIRGDDIDVIVPTGIVIGGIRVGDSSGYPVQINPSRVRIRGSTDGSRGGRVGQIRGQCIDPDIATDLIVDGVDINGDGSFGAGESDQGFRGNFIRAFIHNVRGISAGYFSQTGWQNVVFANCTFFAGAATRAAVGYVEGWGFRDPTGQIYFIDCDIQTTRYHVLRPYTYDTDSEYLFVKNCRIINLSEGKMIWAGNRLSEPSFGYWWGAVIEGNSLYTGRDSGCSNGDAQLISLNSCTYSRITNNTIYQQGTGNIESWDVTDLQAERDLAISVANADTTLVSRGRAPLPSDAHSSNTDLNTNTFATLTGHPGWRGPGDPRDVPLPSGYTLAEGEGSCPAIWT